MTKAKGVSVGLPTQRERDPLLATATEAMSWPPAITIMRRSGLQELAKRRDAEADALEDAGNVKRADYVRLWANDARGRIT